MACIYIQATFPLLHRHAPVLTATNDETNVIPSWQLSSLNYCLFNRSQTAFPIDCLFTFSLPILYILNLALFDQSGIHKLSWQQPTNNLDWQQQVITHFIFTSSFLHPDINSALTASMYTSSFAILLEQFMPLRSRVCCYFHFKIL